MASIFLSPSVQEYNKYLTGGDEEQYMNLIADAMMPYLEASGTDVRLGMLDYSHRRFQCGSLRSAPGAALQRISRISLRPITGARRILLPRQHSRTGSGDSLRQ